MDMNNAEGQPANGEADKMPDEPVGLKMCKALYKTLEEHEPGLDNPKVKRMHGAIHKMVHKTAESEYPGKHDIPEPEEKSADDGEAQQEPPDDEEMKTLAAASTRVSKALEMAYGAPRA